MIRRFWKWIARLRPAPVPAAPDEDHMLAFYSQFLRRGDLCFDIGCNVGNRLKIFRRLGCRVVALEPQSSCCRFLREHFGDDPEVTVLQMAAAAREGELPIQIANADTISSMSPEWIRRVRASGRFEDYVWQAAETVRCTTLASLIAAHGRPRFIKIDVEGFEPEVVRGLTQPVPALSFEWTPEYLAATHECLAHLSGLGFTEANYSLGESMRFALDPWGSLDTVGKALHAYREDTVVFGDVYVRCPAES